MPQTVRVPDHPLLQHKLTLLRRTQTPTEQFRQLAREISLLLGYELLRDLPVESVTIETPLETMQSPRIAGKTVCLVSILRAGNAILDGMLDLLPSAPVGHIGLYRDHATLQPIEYYLKLPEDIAARPVILLDPMLATGNSAIAAVAMLQRHGVRSITFGCLIAAPEGVAAMTAAHPDVRIVACAIDRCLDARGYIRPGLGDAGDRYYGTC